MVSKKDKKAVCKLTRLPNETVIKIPCLQEISVVPDYKFCKYDDYEKRMEKLALSYILHALPYFSYKMDTHS